MSAVYHCMTRTVNGEHLFADREKEILRKMIWQDAILPVATVLRCRVRYFTDGAILGSQEFVSGFVQSWQLNKGRKHPPKPHLLRGADWAGLTTIQSLKKKVFT